MKYAVVVIWASIYLICSIVGWVWKKESKYYGLAIT